MNIEQLTAFLGWYAVVNVIVLFLAGIGVMSLRNWMMGIHSSMFGLDESQLANQYFNISRTTRSRYLCSISRHTSLCAFSNEMGQSYRYAG